MTKDIVLNGMKIGDLIKIDGGWVATTQGVDCMNRDDIVCETCPTLRQTMVWFMASLKYRQRQDEFMARRREYVAERRGMWT